MSQDLVDALAKRLYEAGEASPFGHRRSWEERAMAQDSEYHRIAKETLRQMRWARGFDARQPMVAGLLPCRCQQLHMAGHPIFQQEGHGDVDRLDLTLAPDEFQP